MPHGVAIVRPVTGDWWQSALIVKERQNIRGLIVLFRLSSTRPLHLPDWPSVVVEFRRAAHRVVDRLSILLDSATPAFRDAWPGFQATAAQTPRMFAIAVFRSPIRENAIHRYSMAGKNDRQRQPRGRTAEFLHQSELTTLTDHRKD